jgi:HlyD family secretion protein
MSDVTATNSRELVPGGNGLPALRPAGLPGGVGGGLPSITLDAPAPRTRGAMLLGLLMTGLLVGGLTAWSTLAPLAEAAIAPGMIKVEGTRRTIQHFEGGIVREIMVRDGDRVAAGQVLMRLESAQAAAQLETLRSQVWALMAQDARLTSELAGAKEVAYPPDLLSATEARAMEAMTGQRALFDARQASLESQLMVLRSRIEQHSAAIDSARAQQEAQRRMLVLLKSEEQTVRQLLAQGLERMPRLLALQRNVAATDGTIADLESQQARSRSSIAETENQIRQLLDQRIQDVSAELRELRPRLAESEEKLRAATDVSTRLEITAPEEGVVLNSRFFTVGAVIRAGEPVVDLVPVRDRLVAEVNLQPNDIDVVHTGLQAEVRLPAFKQRLVPYLHGEVIFVASDVTMDERSREAYYKVNIRIDQDQLDRLENVELRPGMPVEAQIRTGERSFARYMIQPVLDSFHRAFREQ